MQDKNQIDVKKIFKEICLYLNVKGIRALANDIGIKESTIYTWIKRGKIADIWALKKALPDLNEEWLITGNGPMLKDAYQADENNDGKFEINEHERTLIRHYRTLANLDDDILKEIQTWVNDMCAIDPGAKSWFRIEFQNRFPEFDDWKAKVIKKRESGNIETKVVNE